MLKHIKNLDKGVKSAILSRIVVIIVSLATVLLIGTRNVAGWNVDVPLAGIFARWDSSYYLTIAQDGYIQENLYAFRPLYPLLLRLVATLLNSINWQTMTVIGFIANNLFFFLSVLFLYKLTELVLDREHASRTVVLFSFQPATVYLLAIYPEALYISLLFASFYYLQRSKVFTSAFLAFLAALTRPEGVFVSVIYLMKGMEYVKVSRWRLNIQRSFLQYILSGMFPVMGMIILGLYVGNLMSPFYAELEWDKWTLGKFIGVWWMTEPDGPPAVLSYIVLLLSLFTLLFEGKKFFKVRNLDNYYVWSLLLMSIFILEADFRSIPRLTLQLTPIYWVISSLSYWKIIFALLIPLAVYGVILYASWFPIL